MRDNCAECKKLLDENKDRYERDSKLFCSRRCAALYHWKVRPA